MWVVRIFIYTETQVFLQEDVMIRYVGFAIADSMFKEYCFVSRRAIDVEIADELIDEETVSCVNKSHQSTIKAVEQRFGIVLDVPKKPPLISLAAGDQLIVISVRGLPRQEGEYTDKQVAGATFEFALWEVLVAEDTESEVTSKFDLDIALSA